MIEPDFELSENSIDVVVKTSGERLDVFASNQSDFTRSQIQRMIEKGNVLVDDMPQKSNYRLSAGQVVTIKIVPSEEWSVSPENIPLDIVYQDEDICVVNKPQGMVVHPAPGHPSGTLVNALMYHVHDLSGIGGVMRPGIVHRIDRMTSGLLVIAKNDFSHLQLSEQFSEHSAYRNYIALVHDNLKEDTGIIDAPIARHPTDRKRMAVVQGGKDAVTHWRVLERFGAYTLLNIQLETGRTHQIRVHMAHIKHPVAGDDIYGSKTSHELGLQGQALHAYQLSLMHPRTKVRTCFYASIPSYFLEACRKLGYQKTAEEFEHMLKENPVI